MKNFKVTLSLTSESGKEVKVVTTLQQMKEIAEVNGLNVLDQMLFTLLDETKGDPHDESFLDVEESSSIKRIMYNHVHDTLTVIFKNEQNYRYYNVPVNLYWEFKMAESKGKFLNEKIRDKFEYEKI